MYSFDQNHQISDNVHGVEISGFSVTQILHEINFENLEVLFLPI